MCRHCYFGESQDSFELYELSDVKWQVSQTESGIVGLLNNIHKQADLRIQIAMTSTSVGGPDGEWEIKLQYHITPAEQEGRKLPAWVTIKEVGNLNLDALKSELEQFQFQALEDISKFNNKSKN